MTLEKIMTSLQLKNTSKTKSRSSTPLMTLMRRYLLYAFQNTKHLCNVYLFAIIASLLVACQSGNVEQKNNIQPNLQNDTTIKYAKGFSIQSSLNYTIVSVFGVKQDTTAKYVLYKTEKPILKSTTPLYTI